MTVDAAERAARDRGRPQDVEDHRAVGEPRHPAARPRRRRHARGATAFLTGLNQPFGMVHVNGTLYVANTDARRALPVQRRADADRRRRARRSSTCRPAATTTTGRATSSPAPTARSCTSRSAPPPTSTRRASTSRTSAAPRSSRSTRTAAAMRVFASGLRNPNGMDWEPATGALWTAVNERDMLGDDLVPDYITSVRDGGFYGWPYSYFGQHEDPRRAGQAARPRGAGDRARLSGRRAHGVARPCCSTAARHSPTRIAAARSWRSAARGTARRSPATACIFVPFNDGKPSGPIEDFLTGFIANAQASEGVRPAGRPRGAARWLAARRRRRRREDLARPIFRLKPEAALSIWRCRLRVSS